MTHTHILRIGNAVLTVKVREMPERVVAQCHFDPTWHIDLTHAASFFLAEIAVHYRGDARPFCVHEANGKQVMQL